MNFAQAIVIGLLQGISQLFSGSRLGRTVLVPRGSTARGPIQRLDFPELQVHPLHSVALCQPTGEDQVRIVEQLVDG